MDLGAFSVSLSVKDLATSIAFYEKLGFELSGGDAENQGYVIMANQHAIIGLFQGMFEGNILTFNPGLNQDKEVVSDFTDVRAIQQSLLDSGIELKEKADPESDGPAHVTLTDPDGNAILIDQFFPKPA